MKPQPTITIVDYGMGNIFSVVKALELYGARVELTADEHKLKQAGALVLPGDGAFQAAINNLQSREIYHIIQEHIHSGKWLFGICLGFQLLFERSEEFGETEGFGFFPGSVKRFRGDFTVPHMGWNQVKLTREQIHPILAGLSSPANFYFIHSYYATCAQLTDEQGICNYHQDFSAIAARDNVFATQFHPEKSHEDGLVIIGNFVELVAGNNNY
jgi:glutamine amidotransferase